MPTGTYRQRPMWKSGLADSVTHTQSNSRSSVSRRSVQREGSGARPYRTAHTEQPQTPATEEPAEVPFRGIRLEDVVVFEVPPSKLSAACQQQVNAVLASSPNASLTDADHVGGGGRRMWFLGHVTRLDEETVALSRTNLHFEEPEARRLALESKANATELALEEVVCRRRQVEDRFLNLEQARQAVSAISPAEVHELQSYQHPPAGVRRVLEAVLTILGSPVAGIAGWPAIRTAVRDPHFLDEVNSFNADSMSMARRDELRARFEQDPLLLSESSGMLAVSVATRSLRTWVNAQLLYDGLDDNPYHVRGGADVMRLDSRAHALEEDLRVFYELLEGRQDAERSTGAARRSPSKIDELPAWPELLEPMDEITVPYSWLVCRLDPPVRVRTDILPSERQFIEELWGYRVQDPPPSPQDYALSPGDALPGNGDAYGRVSLPAESYTEAAAAIADEEDALSGFGEPVQVSCAHDTDAMTGSARGDEDSEDDAEEVPVDVEALRKQRVREQSVETADRYAHITSGTSDGA